MTELINSFKIFASAGTEPAKTMNPALQNVPLVTIGRADSCSESGFNQWRDAMRMVARLPGGLPPEFRIRLWENLADRYLQQRGLDWSRVVAKCRSLENTRDEDIADQIEKDLHRTGCTGFSGAKQVVLKRVLIAYAKWNPQVGYCQGFNMIGAMLLQMTLGDEALTLKIFVFLIEGVLPQGYFSHGLRGLAIDMAVFRDLLRMRKPTLNAHLTKLQKCDENPPLTDVFTMHWFLTLFIHCLPTPSVLRIWDLVLLEGSEVLLRTALVLWAAIETRILCVSSADEFYSVMGVVTREMLEFGLMDPNSLVKCIVSVGPFPFPGLEELRQKHRALMAKDTPYKSFFLAKRELDNLKRHYSAMRHRQKGSAIMHNLKALDTRIIPTGKSASFSQRSAAPLKKTVVASPKPKPRRANSGGRNLNHSNMNKNNIGRQDTAERLRLANRNNAKASSPLMPQGSNDKSKQVTVPWNMISKKPKSFRKRNTSASSANTSSSSSSSSTELCDSASDEEENDLWEDEVRESEPTDVTTEDVGKESRVEPPAAAPPTDIVPQIQLSTTEELREGTDCPTQRSPVTSVGDVVPTSAQIDELPPPMSPEALGLDLNLDLNDTKCIDANDSQRFLEEMSRLGKSDSFYESLSHRICQLQFQNLRILTTCTTIPEPVIMPNIEYSPLPSPMSPHPSSPLPTGSHVAMLTAPQFTGKLVLSPSLNHLTLSTSPRGSISGPASQPPTPHTPAKELISTSRASSRRQSKSSLSSIDNDDSVFIDRKPPLSELSQVGVNPEINPTDESLVGARVGSCETVSTQLSREFLQSDSQESTTEILPGTAGDKLGDSHVAVHGEDLLGGRDNAGDEQTSLEGGNYYAGVNSSSETQTEGGPPVSEDISSVIRENIAILQRLKLKPVSGDSDSNDSWSTSSGSELSEAEDVGGSSTGTSDRVTTMGFSGNSSRLVAVPSGRKRSVTRCASSESMSAGEGRKSSLSRTNTVCSHCSRNTQRRSSSSQSCTAGGVKGKVKKNFNPFPTARKARVRTTKFGLYS